MPRATASHVVRLLVLTTLLLVLAAAQTSPAKSGGGHHRGKAPKNPKNPPIMFLPGMLGSFITVQVTDAGCSALPACATARDDPEQRAFVESVIKGPVVANTFFDVGGDEALLPQRVALLLALLTQSYSPPPTNTIDYPAGVTVGNNGTAAEAYCDGVANAYRYGLIGKYFVGQVGYVVGTNFACQPYDWLTDMLGLEQGGLFETLEQRVRELYLSPANDPPSPRMVRRKVVLMGHSDGTLVATSALLARPGLRAMIDDTVLLSPVSAGAALTWEISLYGLDSVYLPPGYTQAQQDAIRFVLWSLAQTSAVNPVLAPYSLPPYRFKRLRAPEYPNGFAPDTEVGYATAAPGSGDPDAVVDITVATQLAALQGPLFRPSSGPSPFAYIEAIWARSHSYDQNVQSWSGRAAPRGVRLLCAYGVALPTILKSAVKAPFPYPQASNMVERFQVFKAGVSRDTGNQIFTLKGDSIVNKQGSNGCDRMADNTGGQVFTSASPDTGHIQVLNDGPGANRLLNRVMTAAGVNVRPSTGTGR